VVENDHDNSTNSGDAHTIKGVVVSEDNKGNFLPLAGASIVWAGTQEGTISDKHGAFSIPENKAGAKLIVSYTGYQSDSIEVNNAHQLQIQIRKTHFGLKAACYPVGVYFQH